MTILQGNSCSITQKSGELWTVQTDLQQIYPKSDRLLVDSRDAELSQHDIRYSVFLYSSQVVDFITMVYFLVKSI